MAKITVIGIGPGSMADMTERAKRAIETAQVVAGYHTYIELIRPLLTNKKIIDTGMTGEIDRCRAALKAAADGSDTAVISSGDAGVYGMAGLVLELLLTLPPERRPSFEVIAGVSAVNAAAALLGAPLMHDFALVSLSDLLTPWEVIVKRIEAAGAGDFVLALYNPKSRGRQENIVKVREIMLKYRSPHTPVGIVSKVSRAGEHKVITTLENFLAEDMDMFSLVIIGSSATYVKEGYMITPRGYAEKESER